MNKLSFLLLLLLLIALVWSLGACVSSDLQEGQEIPHENDLYVDSIQSGHAPELLIETATGTVAGDYIYRKVFSVEQGKPIIMKYHVTTGQASPACQDPYCTHMDETCSFYVTADADVVSIGNTICFPKKDADGMYYIVIYDGTDLILDEIYRGDKKVLDLASYQYHFYYTLLEDYITVLYRYDTRSGETDKVTEINMGSLAYIENDWIYCKWSQNVYFIYDLEGLELRNANQNDYRGYVYENRDIHSTKAWRDLTISIYRTQAGQDTWEKIAEKIGPEYKVHDKFLYFIPLPLDEQERCVVDSGVSQYDYWGGNVYMMNLDGSEAKLLCHAEDVVLSGFPTADERSMRCGDWIGIPVFKKKANDSKMYQMADFLFVNLKTGEYTISVFNDFE